MPPDRPFVAAPDLAAARGRQRAREQSLGVAKAIVPGQTHKHMRRWWAQVAQVAPDVPLIIVSGQLARMAGSERSAARDLGRDDAAAEVGREQAQAIDQRRILGREAQRHEGAERDAAEPEVARARTLRSNDFLEKP